MRTSSRTGTPVHVLAHFKTDMLQSSGCAFYNYPPRFSFFFFPPPKKRELGPSRIPWRLLLTLSVQARPFSSNHVQRTRGSHPTTCNLRVRTLVPTHTETHARGNVYTFIHTHRFTHTYACPVCSATLTYPVDFVSSLFSLFFLSALLCVIMRVYTYVCV